MLAAELRGWAWAISPLCSVTRPSLPAWAVASAPDLVFRFGRDWRVLLSQKCGLRKLPINGINISYVALHSAPGDEPLNLEGVRVHRPLTPRASAAQGISFPMIQKHFQIARLSQDHLLIWFQRVQRGQFIDLCHQNVSCILAAPTPGLTSLMWVMPN